METKRNSAERLSVFGSPVGVNKALETTSKGLRELREFGKVTVGTGSRHGTKIRYSWFWLHKKI